MPIDSAEREGVERGQATAMIDLVEDLKHKARVLHDAARAGEPAALCRLRTLPELRAHDDAALASAVLRRHCLGALAHALGFTGWPHARAVLGGEAVGEAVDLGTLMHRESGGAYWNIWSASYEEASAIRKDHGGFLLAYKRQFLIVESYFIESIGLDPDDPDWGRIGRDWPRPLDRAAWTRLTARAIEARLSGY